MDALLPMAEYHNYLVFSTEGVPRGILFTYGYFSGVQTTNYIKLLEGISP
jgi:hypothetical protein